MSIATFVRSTPFRFFLLGVAVRLLFVALFPGVNYYNGITNEYLNCVRTLLGGHGLNVFVDIAPWSSGQVHFAYQPFVGRPIGYVLFAASIWLVTGAIPVAIQVVQAIVTALSVLLVYALAMELFESSPARSDIAKYAALLAAVWPNQARFEIALLPDGLTTLIVLGLVLELVCYVKRRGTRNLVGAGLVVALSIFLRPDLVLFPLFLLVGLLLLMPARRAFIATTVIVVLLGLAIGINTWKNFAISGETVPLNLGSGTTMYEGISQFGDTLGTTYADERLAHNVFDTKELFYPNGVTNDRRVWQIALDTIKHHPGFYSTVVLRRVPLMFTVRGLYFSDTSSLANPNNDLSKRFPGKYIAMFQDHPVEVTVRFLSPLLGWLLVILGFWGLYRALRANWRDHLIVALFLLYFISTHLLTNVEPRYFYPALPLLYAYAAQWLRHQNS